MTEVVLLGIEMDVRVGGGYRYTMGLESGESWSIVGIYREVRPPEKLIYTWSYEEEEMRVGETLITVEFPRSRHCHGSRPEPRAVPGRPRPGRPSGGLGPLSRRTCSESEPTKLTAGGGANILN